MLNRQSNSRFGQAFHFPFKVNFIPARGDVSSTFSLWARDHKKNLCSILVSMLPLFRMVHCRRLLSLVSERPSVEFAPGCIRHWYESPGARRVWERAGAMEAQGSPERLISRQLPCKRDVRIRTKMRPDIHTLAYTCTCTTRTHTQ